MATQATQIRNQAFGPGVSWKWFREFIRWEVAPYPDRTNTVIRMTVTATLVMILVVTFRIPNAFLASLYAILLAREDLTATWNGGRTVIVGFVAASLYTLFGMILFRDYPLTHFFWVIASLFLAFFVIRTATNYLTAATFAIPIGITLPLWDRPLPSEIQVEGTLWPILVIAVGAGVTLATEAVYRIFDRSDPLISSIDDLLLVAQQVVENVARRSAPPKPLFDKILQYQMIGTGRLRAALQRQGFDPTRRAQRSALISLAGRLISLAADLVHALPRPDDEDALRLRALAERISAIRTEFRASGSISASSPVLDGQPSSSFPVLQEMEQIVSLLTEFFQDDEVVAGSGNPPAQGGWRSLFVPDAFQNPEYLRFAFAGCLAAGVCYFLYNALDWPGIGQTSVITCIVTALTTVGSSLQAQFLRLAGFVAGGLLMGISAQILILPGIDTIFGFALFFAVATAIAAWFTTSSPRLSFFGVQMALSFYFINLQDSHIQTDLTIARDKALGVLLGILAMGLIFDRFGTRSDQEQLQKLLVRNMRMLAQLGTPSPPRGKAVGVSPFARLRGQINDSFASLESQMDAVRFEFEFRNRRANEIGECDRIQSAQPALRSIFLLQLSLHSRRGLRQAGSELTPEQNRALDQFLDEYSNELTHIAAWIAHEQEAPALLSEDSLRQLQLAFAGHDSSNSQAIVDICRNMSSSLLLLRDEC